MNGLKIVSILNLKGGVGKSITTINLAHELSTKYGKRVLVVDADPQNDLSQFYGWGDGDGLLRLLSGKYTSAKELIKPTTYQNVTLIPASYDVYSLDVGAHMNGQSGVMSSFGQLKRECEMFDLADIILVDCPPGFNSSCCAAMAASTDIIIPTTTDKFSVRGLTGLMGQLAGLRKINPTMCLDGILITMWHNVDVVKAAETSLRASGYPVFNTHIRRTDKVPEATWASQPLEIYSKRSAASYDYTAFAAELTQMWGWEDSNGKQ
jgi:chromosome partitioning protein